MSLRLFRFIKNNFRLIIKVLWNHFGKRNLNEHKIKDSHVFYVINQSESKNLPGHTGIHTSYIRENKKASLQIHLLDSTDI